MTAGTLKFKVSFNCDEKISEKDGVAPDPVLEPLLKIFADGQVAKNDGEWKEEVEKDKKFRPLGNKLHEIQLEQQGESRQFEVYACDSTVSGFRDYHSRMQPWILFYIDAASFIDFDDANWRFFVMYERFKDEDDGSVRYAFAGYTTVYQYYAYPHMIRPRVSQMLVLPPFQRMGLGAHMLEEVQKFYWKNKEVRDITGK
jgi:histone acetyltransferase 1